MIYRDDGLVLLGDERVRQEIEDQGGLRVDFFQDRWRGGGFAISLMRAAKSSCC